MKKIIIISIFLMPVCGIGQQWRPITTAEKFNYMIDTAIYISNVIRVDSSNIQSGDSVFFLNRIVTSCPGTTGNGTKLSNQPQFLGRRMIKKPGGIYMFKDPGEFWLKTLAALNTTWVFDSSANITAQVTAKTSEMVLNQPDSVKTISLSNGQIIKLSKNHGILRFPMLGSNHFYQLKGIAGRNLGILIPEAPEFYNFTVGDVFQYKSSYLNYGLQEGRASLYKKTVLTRDSSSSGYSYEMFICGMYWWENPPYSGDTVHYSYVTTEVANDSVTHYCNLNPHEIALDPFEPSIVSHLASTMKIFPDTGQTISRLVGKYDGFPPDEDPMYYTKGIDTLISADYFEYVEKFTIGLGRVKNDYYEFESKSYESMIGYVKNGDTTGIVYSCDYLLQNATENLKNDGICIFPNPASEKIFIQLFGYSLNYIEVSLYTIQGTLSLSKSFLSSENVIEINVKELPIGLYLVKVTANNFSVIRKLVLK